MIRPCLFVALLLVLGARFASAGKAPTGRLEVTVTEKGGGKLPCRVHLVAGGKGVYPAGLPRFERDGHFGCPGRFGVDLPAGKASLRI